MRKNLFIVVPAALVAIVGVSWWFARGQQAPTVLSAPPATASTEIVALGTIQPKDGLVRVAATTPGDSSPIIDTLSVKELQHVTKGEVIAKLRGSSLLQASAAANAARIEAARYRLQQLQAAPKGSELGAQKLETERRELNLNHVNSELARDELLRKTEDISIAEVEAKRSEYAQAQKDLAKSQQQLKLLSELRPADEAVLNADIRSAEADRARQLAELQLYTIHSPIDGQIIRVLAHSGEAVTPSGIVEILEDAPLYAFVEVPEADVSRLKVGQAASITAEFSRLQCRGVVDVIGRTIARSEVVASDPAAFNDKRVVVVKVRLENAAPDRWFLNSKVSVHIQP